MDVNVGGEKFHKPTLHTKYFNVQGDKIHKPTPTVATPLWPNVGVKPNTSKVGDLESSPTPECSKLDSKAQNTSH